MSSAATEPAPGSENIMLDGITTNGSTVWVAGEADSPAGGEPRIHEGNHGKWSIDNAPNAGGSGFSDIPGGITAIDGQLWLAGMYNTATGNELPLIEHR